jgi:iron complex outermembrane receptor protein
VELGSLERAEVERGTASALYGNAAGGVVLLESERPPDAPVAVTARAVTGSDGLARWQAGLGGRAAGGSADWALRGARLQYDGFRQFSSQTSTRVTGGAGAGDEHRGLGAARASLAWVDYDAHNPGSLPEALHRVAPDTAWPNNVRQQTGEAGRHGQLGLAWRRAVPGGALDASVWGLRRKLDNPIPPTIIALDRRAAGTRLTYGASIMGPGGLTARLTAGGELQRQRDDRQNWVNTAGARGALSLDQLEHVTTAAAFGQADLAFGDHVTLLAGIRRDRARFAAGDRLVSATNPDDSGERIMEATSPSVGVSVAVLPRVRLYANASRGFETPTTTELANRPTGAGGFNPTLQPQRARSVEAGLNGSWAAGATSGTVQLAAYDTRLTDALLPFEVPGAAGRQFFRNAGRLRHRGVEAAGSAALGSNVIVRAAYTLVDARFDVYRVGDSSYAGRRVPGVAPRRFDAAVEWREAGGAFVALEERAQSWTPADDPNRARSAGYLLSGVRGAWRPIRLGDAALVPFAGVTNLTDRRWDAAVTVNATGARYFEPGPGRSVYLGADLSVAGRRR